jgi:hypothetical protein
LTVVGTKNHIPFTRALAYQAYRSFKMWGKDSEDFVLPVDSDISIYLGLLLFIII